MYSMATLCNTHAKSTNVIYVYYGYIMYYTCEIDTCNICILWLHMHVIYAFMATHVLDMQNLHR